MIVVPPLTAKPTEITVMHTDSPPAYSSDLPSPRGASSHLPPPTVDQVHIFSRHNDIKGTYYIDPNVPSLRQKCKRKSPQMLHASFRTRKADISIDLGTTGEIYDTKKANVAVATHKGDIKINLLQTPSIRPLGLDVTSRKGNIVLFLPETFTGIVHLMTRKGEMAVLPALANIMKVVKTSEREIIFMITPKNFPNGADNSGETTLCQLSTRKGTVVVGLSGRDQYLPQPSFWKKLGGYLRGDKQ